MLGLHAWILPLPAVTGREARLSCSVSAAKKQKKTKMLGVCAGKAGLMASQAGKGTVVFRCYKGFFFFFFLSSPVGIFQYPRADRKDSYIFKTHTMLL